MFSVDDRTAVGDRVVEWGRADPRIVSGAVIGSLALGNGDRWSDIDLTFAVQTGISVQHVLEDWSRRIVTEFDAVQLFDLPSGSAIYRVFLLPGCLQLDLSFSPEADFAPRGPRFRLLFGSAGDMQRVPGGRSDAEIFGYAVHHALRTRFCVERERWWQAEYWLGSLREEILGLACHRRGLEGSHGRGFDDLPAELLARCVQALPAGLERAELLRALSAAVAQLLDEAGELARPVRSRLLELTRD